jgi:hypothetical protein
MKVWISAIVYAAAIADEAAGWLVRYVDPAFAYFKIAAFLLLETSLLLLIVIVSLSLIESRRQLR